MEVVTVADVVGCGCADVIGGGTVGVVVLGVGSSVVILVADVEIYVAYNI
jgi:hypothetical protein